jgi:hypothetical protein
MVVSERTPDACPLLDCRHTSPQRRWLGPRSGKQKLMELRHVNLTLRCVLHGHQWTAWCELKPLSLIARCCERCSKVEFDPTRDEIAALPTKTLQQ